MPIIKPFVDKPLAIKEVQQVYVFVHLLYENVRTSSGSLNTSVLTTPPGVYSFRNAVTGLLSAALIAWKLIVINVINKADVPAIINAAQPICILNAKSCNQLLIPQ